jgi:FKBP-type peptidyl-prolyl cis-trans isomerase SlyD
MDITLPCVVTLTWTLSDAQGQLIDELNDPIEFLFGGDDLLPKVEQALDGQAVGFETELHLEPENAFGDYDPALMCFESRAIFPDGVEVGMQFEGLPPGAVTADMPGELVYTVTEVYPDHVVLDANHPLAGIALRIAMKVVDVREATPAEVEAGSVSTDSPLAVLNSAPPNTPLH